MAKRKISNKPKINRKKAGKKSNELTLNQLRSRVAQVKKYLDMQTSTVAGTKRLIKKLKKKLGFENMTDIEFKDVFDTVSEAENLSGEKWGSTEKEMAEQFYNEHKGKITPSELADYIKGIYGGVELEKLKLREKTEEAFRKKFDTTEFLK